MISQDILNTIQKSAEVSLDEAIQMVAQTVKNGRMVYLFSGDLWSNGVFEPFFKAGSLCALSPMPEPTLATTSCASRAYYLRGARHVGEFLCGYYRSLHEGDCILMADHGDALASEEAIQFANAHGIKTIRLSPKPVGADVCVPLVAAQDVAVSEAAVSLAISLLSSTIVLEAAKRLDQPDIWLPFTEDNEEVNEKYMDQYRTLIKKL